jgi:hypothetical protein
MSESSGPDEESWTFLVEVLQQNLLGGGPPDEHSVSDEGVDPHPMPGHALPAPLFNPGPAQPNEQNNAEAGDGWGHWAMGPVQEQPQPMEVEVEEQLNSFMPELQEEVDMADEEQGPPLLDATSFVHVSSSSSEDTASHIPPSTAVVSPGTLAQTHIAQPVLPLGESLLNIFQAYSIEDDSLGVILESDTPSSSLVPTAAQDLDTMEDNLFLPDNVNLV